MMMISSHREDFFEGETDLVEFDPREKGNEKGMPFLAASRFFSVFRRVVC